MAIMIKDRVHFTQNTRINILIIYALLALSLALNAQADKKYIRQGNRDYEKNKYSESEIWN